MKYDWRNEPQSFPSDGSDKETTSAGVDGAKRKTGSTVHIAVDTLGHLLAL